MLLKDSGETIACGRETNCCRSLLFFFLNFHGFKVLSFEDLPAIEALHVVHAVSTGEDDSFLMLAGGLHNQRLR